MATKYPGVSPPISTKLPTKSEIRLTEALENTLQAYGMYEDKRRTEERESALRHLDQLTKQFVRTVSLRRNTSPEYADSAGGAVFTFGSYKLGVNSVDSDIDTLCVVPRFVYRTDFFLDMLNILKNTPCITHITAVSDAFVPVIKFKYNDIPIDLVFARVNAARVPNDFNLQDSTILQGLDDSCIRSINGTRVADDIMRLVPDLKTFKIALRCIKLWATRKAIYSNAMGFFGGVAWAICVARICQLYPCASASFIISRFFNLLPLWNWSSPVLLQSVEDGPPLGSGLRPWQPNRSHRMPVITPSYPSMCCTHNVTESTKRIILGECKMSAKIVDQIMAGKLTWASLFEPHKFFTNYKYYLQVVVSGDSHQGFLNLSGYVEAKMRHLVMQLQQVKPIALVQPFVDGFKSEQLCSSAEDVRAATHGQPVRQKQNHRQKSTVIYNKVFYIGLYIRLRPEHSRTLDLTNPIEEFITMVKKWPGFDMYHMGIVVETVLRDALPKSVHPKRDVIISKRALSKSPSPLSNDSNGKKMKTVETGIPIPVANNTLTSPDVAKNTMV